MGQKLDYKMNSNHNTKNHSQQSSKVKIIAHRGLPRQQPENSLNSFKAALDLNVNGNQVDGIEGDLHLTKNSDLVFSHDPTIDLGRCKTKDEFTPTPAVISKMSTQDVLKFRCKSSANSEGTARSIKTFRDVLIELLPYQDKQDFQFFVELKTYDYYTKLKYPIYSENFLYGMDYKKIMVERVLSDIQSSDFDASKIVLQSFDKDILEMLNQARLNTGMDFKLSYLYRGEHITKVYPMLANFKKLSNNENFWIAEWTKAKNFILRNNINYFSPNFKLLSHSLFSSEFKNIFVKSKVVSIVPWTVNEISDWDIAIKNYGADGLITDKSDELLRHLNLTNSD